MPTQHLPDPPLDPEIESWMRGIAERLTSARKAQDFSREELAERIGITNHVMYGLEAGVANVTLRTFLRIAKTLDTTPHDLLPAPHPWSKGSA